MDPTSFNLFAGSSYSSGGGPSLASGWYPMFAVKNFNASQDSIPAPDSEYGMRNALQFNTSATTALNGSESLATIINILDASKYTCNPAFKTSTTYISGFQIKHYQNASTLYDECEATWNGTGFNIYDHACSVQSNLSYALPSQVGTIQTATVNGTNVFTSLSQRVFINCSTRSSRTGSDNWATDFGDYVFLGVTNKNHTSINGDSLDSGWASILGIAFGISDSDGAPTSGQSPMLGIGRRNANYPSLFTNWQERTGSGHGGRTASGYSIVYGKVI